jgi:TorA maturation chaperone TorD
MRIPAIREIVSKYSIKELRQAEEDLLEEREPSIDLGPDEPGDQLTHIIGAISVLEEVEKGVDAKKALRNFTQRVRNSIS